MISNRLAARCVAISVVVSALSVTLPCREVLAQSFAGDGISAAIETETGSLPGHAGDASGEAAVRPHWCNATSALVDDIHKRGGESVMRLDLGEGRVLERYWNASEEVVIEHGADGNSCLVEMRQRSTRR